MTITHHQEPNKGVFVAQIHSQEAGRMTYSRAGEEKFIIDHTIVNDDFRGKSVGKELVFEAVKYARENSQSIIPLCPFAKSVFDRNPEIRDVLA